MALMVDCCMRSHTFVTAAAFVAGPRMHAAILAAHRECTV